LYNASFTAAVIKADVINAVFIAFLYGKRAVCTFRVVDRLRLTIRMVSSYINLNLLYLESHLSFITARL